MRLCAAASGMWVFLLEIDNQMTPSSARALWGYALGHVVRRGPALHETYSCSGCPSTPGRLPYVATPPRGDSSPPGDAEDRSHVTDRVCCVSPFLTR